MNNIFHFILKDFSIFYFPIYFYLFQFFRFSFLSRFLVLYENGLIRQIRRRKLEQNYNKHIARYLKKQRQSDNAIWSINRIQRDIFLQE